MSVLLLAADPRLGAAGTLRAHAGRLGGASCVLVATREPVCVDLGSLLAAHRANRALLTVAVRRRDVGEDSDALIVGDDGRVIAVQPSPLPDEALSDLTDAGIYAVAPEALDHVGDGARELTGEVLSELLAWDVPVYVHPLAG